jgi:long-subunit acyl-CoA synthetase (AMP-forming)
VNAFRTHDEWGVLDTKTEKAGFGQCLWNTEAAMKMAKTRPDNDAGNLVQVLEKSKDKFGARRAVGWREIVQVHMIEENGAQREKIELQNEYQWFTYQEYYDRVLCLARGLSCFGVEPRSKVVIYAETQRDWLVTAFAAWLSNCQVVTIYATLGEEGAVHGINETEAATVVTDSKLMKTLAKALAKCPKVTNIVTMKPCDAEAKSLCKGVKIQSVDDLVGLGKTSPFSITMPTADDVAVIMYTSGTTGLPKGVQLTHGNFLACLAGVQHALAGLITDETRYLCYLPLAHIMELGAEVAMIGLGVSLGFGTPHTLTDTGVKLKVPESMGDAPCFKPTLMVFAPAVLDKIYQRIQSKRDTLGGVGQAFFRWGLNSGERHFTRGQVGANRFYNKVVFKKVQALVGGDLRAIITGSAPLSPEIQKYVQSVLDVPVRQGYGLTETCGGSAIGFWGDNRTSTIGPPTVSTVIRLADWQEGNYMNSDKDKPEIGMRRGEVLVGGPCVSPGYFISTARPNAELKKKNEEDFVVIDGIRFFRTGDIGQIHPNGTLEIIDRKKDLWKGPNGEYVALTKVEAALKLCEYVDLPMCYGKTGGAFPVTLICPQKPKLLALGAELALGNNFETLCTHAEVVKRVSEACKAVCKDQKLAEFEIPQKFALIADLWTPENNMLTATVKLKRPDIAAKHKDQIDSMYAA